MTTTTTTPVQDTTPRLAEISATGRSTGSLSTAVQARQFDFVVAEPESFGGTDESANPIEYLLGSLNGCITVVIETIAAELGITVEAIATGARGTLDLRGFAGTADVSPHFQQLRLDLVLTTTASEPEVAELQARVLARCPVYNLIKDAGVDITETSTLPRPARAPPPQPPPPNSTSRRPHAPRPHVRTAPTVGSLTSSRPQTPHVGQSTVNTCRVGSSCGNGAAKTAATAHSRAGPTATRADRDPGRSRAGPIAGLAAGGPAGQWLWATQLACMRE